MKRLFLTLIVALATIWGFAQDVEPSNVNFYEVKGKLKNVPDGTVLQLSGSRGNVDFLLGLPKWSLVSSVLNRLQAVAVLTC